MNRLGEEAVVRAHALVSRFPRRWEEEQRGRGDSQGRQKDRHGGQSGCGVWWLGKRFNSETVVQVKSPVETSIRPLGGCVGVEVVDVFAGGGYRPEA